MAHNVVQSVQPIKSSSGLLLQNKQIFIIEDNLENRVIMRIALTQQGAQVEFDRWGREVPKHLEAGHRIDVILLDLMFPNGITGYNIFNQIRGIRALAAVPIVAVSASDPFTAMPRCQAQGFAGFIAKPIDDDLFAAQIADILAGRSVWYSG
ncbi:MAG TPA: response regulator [Phototrophicaceae bacterium]|nr:response regulator [Phototrophicaceae bacterium]